MFCLKCFSQSVFHCFDSRCSYFTKTNHGLRTHVLCLHRSARALENLVMHANLYLKLSFSSSLLGTGNQLIIKKIDRAADETRKMNDHFLNNTNGTFNADELNVTSVLGPDDSERYDGTDLVDKNSYAIPGASALFGDVYKDHCSFFVTLANSSFENHCNGLLHVLRKNCDVHTKSKREF